MNESDLEDGVFNVMILVCQNCGAEFYDDDYVISGICPDCGIGRLL